MLIINNLCLKHQNVDCTVFIDGHIIVSIEAPAASSQRGGGDRVILTDNAFLLYSD